jgi:hypothetical protein
MSDSIAEPPFVSTSPGRIDLADVQVILIGLTAALFQKRNRFSRTYKNIVKFLQNVKLNLKYFSQIDLTIAEKPV